MDHHHEVESVPKPGFLYRDDGPELSLEPIAHHRAPQAATGSQPDPNLVLGVWVRADGQGHSARPSSPSVDRVEDLGVLEGDNQTGMSCQRPFRRRRLSTLRPPRVLMRWRNPCVRARLRFERLVRCFFIAGHYTNGRVANQGEIA